MHKKQTKYPELDRWFNEGLFVRRQFNGEHFSVGRQMWYVNRLRDQYMSNNGVGCIWGFGKTSGTSEIPFIEKSGWMRAKILDGFKYIPDPDMRDVMRAMILSDSKPLPSAHDISRWHGFAWEQFKYDFALGLFYMHNAKVGLRV